jgi:hypothetical protein
MNSRLVLTLWLVGAVLYAGSTVFLAHAVLGGGSAPADKAKAGAVATAANTQCQKDAVASADAKPAKDAVTDPQKTAAIEPKKPVSAPAPSAAKPAAPETANRDATPPGPRPNAEQRSADNGSPSDDQQAPDASSPDGAPPPDGYEQQDAMGPGGRRHRRYALGAFNAGPADLCASRRLAGARDLAPAGLGSGAGRQ